MTKQIKMKTKDSTISLTYSQVKQVLTTLQPMIPMRKVSYQSAKVSITRIYQSLYPYSIIDVVGAEKELIITIKPNN